MVRFVIIFSLILLFSIPVFAQGNSPGTAAALARSGIYSLVGFKPTAGTTYYVNVWRYSGTAGSYSILASRSSVVSVENEPAVNGIPTEFALEQNYPNPFNPSTTIRYALPTNEYVRLAVYNTLGQEVAVLVNGEQKAGEHTIPFDGANLNSGVYLYRLQANSFVSIRRMVLVK